MARWTKEDLDFLSDHYDREGRIELAKRTGRTLEAVATMAKKLGLTIKTETDPKILTFLRENYVKLGSIECARQLGVTRKQIYSITTNHQIRGGRNNKWNIEEENFLKEHCYKTSLFEIATHLQRTLSSVKNKANKLGILIDKSWTAEEDDILRKDYSHISVKELEMKLHRTSAAIRGRAFSLDLVSSNHIWSVEDDEWFRAYYPIRSNLHCATHIGTTERGISNRANKLGLRKRKIQYCEGDIKTCHRCNQTKNINEFQFKSERNSYSATCKECLGARAANHKPILTPEQERIIRDLYDQCYGSPEIAKIVKFCAKSKISKFIKQVGLSRTAAQVRECKSRKRTGEKVGNLTLVEYIRVGGQPGWRCLCDCGNEKLIKQIYLRTTRSCGCLVRAKGVQSPSWLGYKGVSGGLAARYKSGANYRNIPFEITKKDMWEQFVKQDGKCAFTGLALILSNNSNGTASLDRIDSSKGYTIDNIQWVHKWLNTMKNDLRESDMFGIIKAVYEYRGLANMEMPDINCTLNRVKRKSSV